MAWLPPIMEMDGDWDTYCERLYETFERGLREARFHGLRIGRRRTPEVKGKPDGFWHVTSEQFAQDSQERIPDMRRCERVPWIGPMIDAAGTDRVRCWRSPRQSGKGHTVVVALPSYEYVVILGRRNGRNAPYMVLVTAFPPSRRRRQEFVAAYHAAGEYEP